MRSDKFLISANISRRYFHRNTFRSSHAILHHQSISSTIQQSFNTRHSSKNDGGKDTPNVWKGFKTPPMGKRIVHSSWCEKHVPRLYWCIQRWRSLDQSKLGHSVEESWIRAYCRPSGRPSNHHHEFKVGRGSFRENKQNDNQSEIKNVSLVCFPITLLYRIH